MADLRSLGWRWWLIGTSLFGILVATLSPPLTYFQDEWSLLQSRAELLGGIFVSHMGHFFPIGKLAYVLETLFFASHYGGFIAVNSAVHFVNVLLLDQWFTRHTTACRHHSLRFAVGAIYLTAVGTTFSIQFGMQIAWFLSVMFSLLVLHTLADSQRFGVTGPILMVVAGLTFPSSTLILLLLVAALIAGTYLASVKHVAALTLVAAATGIGNKALANIWLPTDINARGWPLEFRRVAQHWQDVMAWTSSMSLTWLLAPISIVGPSDRTYATQIGDYLREHSVTSALIWLLVISLVYLSIRNSSQAMSRRMKPLLILVVLVVASLISVVFRFSNTRDFLAIRYAPVWLLITVVFWGVLAVQLTERSSLRPLAVVVSSVLVLTAVVGVVRFPSTIRTASESARIEQTQPQLEQLRNCPDDKPIEVFRSIQVSLTPEEMCAIAIRVRGLVTATTK